MSLVQRLTNSLMNQFAGDEAEIVKASEQNYNTNTWVEYLIKEFGVILFVVSFSVREETNGITLMNIYPIGGLVSMSLLRDITKSIDNAIGE